MEELEKAIALLMGHADRTLVIKTMQEKGQALYQQIFNNGHGTATEKAKLDHAKLEGDLKKANEELTAARSKVTELEKGTPALADYQTKIADLEGKLKVSEEGRANDKKETLRSSALALLKSTLVKLRVHPDHAEGIVALQENNARVIVNDQNQIAVMQAGLQIPLSPIDGKSPVEVLAEELVKKVPPELLTAKAGPGSGLNGGPGGGEGGGAEVFASIRKEAEERNKAQERPSGTNEAARRLGHDRIPVPRT